MRFRSPSSSNGISCGSARQRRRPTRAACIAALRSLSPGARSLSWRREPPSADPPAERRSRRRAGRRAARPRCPSLPGCPRPSHPPYQARAGAAKPEPRRSSASAGAARAERSWRRSRSQSRRLAWRRGRRRRWKWSRSRNRPLGRAGLKSPSGAGFLCSVRLRSLPRVDLVEPGGRGGRRRGEWGWGPGREWSRQGLRYQTRPEGS